MIQFYSLYHDNIPGSMVAAHKAVTDKFEIPTRYVNRTTDHGSWLNEIMLTTSDDMVGFFDIDCVPLSKEKVEECILYAKTHNTFIGNAQASNHIPPKSHIFAGPAFFIITMDCWEKLERPTFQQGPNWDVAQMVSYVAESKGKRYRCLYPDCFESEPAEGVWPLSNYGIYGVGTVFENTAYHVFQSRFPMNRQLFVKRCQEIVDGTFSTNGFINSKERYYQGRMVP